MDETDLEILLANNLRVEVDTYDEGTWESMDGRMVTSKRVKVSLYYKDTLISESDSSL